jgi:hypothetical protein
MDAQLKAKWVEALRSGDYKQNRYNIGNVRSKNLCCLGVGAVVCEPETQDFQETDEAVKILAKYGVDGSRDEKGVFSGSVMELIRLNDFEEKSFSEIANYIEANL